MLKHFLLTLSLSVAILLSVVAQAIYGADDFLTGKSAEGSAERLTRLRAESYFTDRSDSEVTTEVREHRVNDLRIFHKSVLERPIELRFSAATLHGSSSEVTHTAPSTSHHEGSYTHSSASLKHWAESPIHYPESYLHNTNSYCHLPDSGPWGPPDGTHDSTSATHTPQSDTHTEPTDTHASSTDTHFVNTDTHATISTTHTAFSDSHDALSTTTYTNGDVHSSASDTHGASSITHLFASSFHSTASGTVTEDDYGNNCPDPARPCVGNVSLVGLDAIDSWDPTNLFEIITLRGQIIAFDSPETRFLNGKLKVTCLDGDPTVVKYKIDDGTQFNDIGAEVTWGSFYHDGCGMHAWHSRELDLVFFPVKPGYAVLEVTLDPLPGPDGDGVAASSAVIYVRVPEWQNHDYRYKAFIQCKDLPLQPNLSPYYGGAGDDRVFSLEGGLNFSSPAVLGSRGAVKAGISLSPVLDSSGGLAGVLRLWGTSIGLLDPLIQVSQSHYFCTHERDPLGDTVEATLSATDANLRFTAHGLVPDPLQPGHPGIRVRKFKLHMAGATPLGAGGAPQINADFTLHIRECAGNSWYHMQGSLDEFPWFECYLDGQVIFAIEPVDQYFVDGLEENYSWSSGNNTWTPID